jgi:hypothetical protein
MIMFLSFPGRRTRSLPPRSLFHHFCPSLTLFVASFSMQNYFFPFSHCQSISPHMQRSVAATRFERAPGGLPKWPGLRNSRPQSRCSTDEGPYR